MAALCSFFLCYVCFLFCFWASLTVPTWLSWNSLSFTRLALNMQPSSCPCLPSVIYNSLISENGLSPSSEMADRAVRPRKWVLWKKPGKWAGELGNCWRLAVNAAALTQAEEWILSCWEAGYHPGEEGLAPKKDCCSGSQVQRTERVGSKWRDSLWRWTAGFLSVLANAEAIDRTRVAKDPSPASSGRPGGVASCSSSAGENGLLLDPQSVLIIFLTL